MRQEHRQATQNSATRATKFEAAEIRPLPSRLPRPGFAASALGITTGIACHACGLPHAFAQRYPRGLRRAVSVAGRRVRTDEVAILAGRPTHLLHMQG